MTLTTMKVPADEVQPGDFLPGLAGKGYVVEVEPSTEVSSFSGRYNVLLGVMAVITFHDEQGEENYLLMNPEATVTVEREEG